MHFKVNQKMEAIIMEQDQECSPQTTELIKGIAAKTKLIRNCIIYDQKGDLEEDQIDFDSILAIVGDWTGYEAGCNELRLPLQSIPPEQYLAFAEGLGRRLSESYGGRECVVYLFVQEDALELRFHTVHNYEQAWLDEDLDSYDCPILCWVQD